MTETSTADSLMSVTEAARRLGITVSRVRVLIRAGRLPAFKVAGGRAWNISERSLNAFIARRRTGNELD